MNAYETAKDVETMLRSNLPFGSEFSPRQVDLAALLEIAKNCGENWEVFESEVKNHYFSSHNTSDTNKIKLANNTKLSMRAYGLIDKNDATLTVTGEALYQLRTDAVSLYKAFAHHILKNCQGMNFVQCILDMHSAGEEIDLTRLRKWLEERGLSVSRGSKAMSTMRLWLEKAGIFVSGYRIDRNRLNEILGLGIEGFEALTTLTPEQRAYLKTVANMGDGQHYSNDIEKLAAVTYGTEFNEKNLPKQVLYPLREAGYIMLERGTREDGRGAKPFLVTATEKLTTDLIVPLLEQLEQQTQADLRPLLRKPLKDIREELNSPDKHIRELALEALAFQLMRLIDLTYVATRLRGIQPRSPPCYGTEKA